MLNEPTILSPEQKKIMAQELAKVIVSECEEAWKIKTVTMTLLISSLIASLLLTIYTVTNQKKLSEKQEIVLYEYKRCLILAEKKNIQSNEIMCSMPYLE
jgi:hypothetical protein